MTTNDRLTLLWQNFQTLDATKTSSLLVMLLVLLVLRAVHVLYKIRQSRRYKKSSVKLRSTVSSNDSPPPLKTLVVLGSGGHTTEMLSLLTNLDAKNLPHTPPPTTTTTPATKSKQQPNEAYQPSQPKPRYHLVYIKADTDTTSLQRIESMQQARSTNRQQTSPPLVYNIPRSREVGQSYASSVFTTLYAQMHAMALLFRIRPQLILTNGPGTCLPICLAGLLLRILAICPTQIVFCESYCRVQTLSLTGQLLYHIVDVFVVHWKDLQRDYPLTQCVNSFVHS